MLISLQLHARSRAEEFASQTRQRIHTHTHKQHAHAIRERRVEAHFTAATTTTTPTVHTLRAHRRYSGCISPEPSCVRAYNYGNIYMNERNDWV